MSDSNIILYRTDDGQAAVSLYARDGSVWMNLAQLAELFATSVQNISLHIINIFKDNELSRDSVFKEYLNTAADGIIIAKNYLNEDELDTLNRLVTIFLETAELRAKNRQDLTMNFWRENVDRLITFQERPLLTGKGRISHEAMEEKVNALYAEFDARRKQFAAAEADKQDLEEIDALETKVKNKRERK